MTMNRTLFNVKLEETTKGRHFWGQTEMLPEQVRAVAQSADILITPWESRTESGPSFPDGTTQFYQYLQQHLKEHSVAILSDQESYIELALHADKIRLPSIIVNRVALPVVVGVVLMFIENNIQGKLDRPMVEFEVVVEGENHNCISIRYEGESDRLAETLISEIDRCFQNNQELPDSDKIKIENNVNKK